MHFSLFGVGKKQLMSGYLFGLQLKRIYSFMVGKTCRLKALLPQKCVVVVHISVGHEEEQLGTGVRLSILNTCPTATQFSTDFCLRNILPYLQTATRWVSNVQTHELLGTFYFHVM